MPINMGGGSLPREFILCLLPFSDEPSTIFDKIKKLHPQVDFTYYKAATYGDLPESASEGTNTSKSESSIASNCD